MSKSKAIAFSLITHHSLLITIFCANHRVASRHPVMSDDGSWIMLDWVDSEGVGLMAAIQKRMRTLRMLVFLCGTLAFLLSVVSAGAQQPSPPPPPPPGEAAPTSEK